MQRMKKKLSMTRGAIYQRKLAAQRKEASLISTVVPKSHVLSNEDFIQLSEINEEISAVFKVLKAVQLLTEDDPMLKMGMDRALAYMSEAAVNLHEFLSGHGNDKAQHE
jgi:hypothetical protein